MREPHTVDGRVGRQRSATSTTAYSPVVRRAGRRAGLPAELRHADAAATGGSCLPAAQPGPSWSGGRDCVDVEVDDESPRPSTSCDRDLPPAVELVEAGSRASTSTPSSTSSPALLADLVGQGKRVLVFTFSRRTLRLPGARLRGRLPRRGRSTAASPRTSATQIMADFRAGAFDVLLATKVASEGLDFEFCSAVVNYDLPWNPMEVEQRIGRIDRFGQTEEKIVILNFHTPARSRPTSSSASWTGSACSSTRSASSSRSSTRSGRQVEDMLFDFALSPEQRDCKSRADDPGARGAGHEPCEDVESAAPILVSSDGADIDGLERDLLASGRYVGQDELGLLVQDWAETFGGQVERDEQVLRLRGNDEMADHVQTLVRTRERLSARGVRALRRRFVPGCQSSCRSTRSCHEFRDFPCFTATHPAARAAVGTPGYKQGRFTLLRMKSDKRGVVPGRTCHCSRWSTGTAFVSSTRSGARRSTSRLWPTRDPSSVWRS